MSRKLPNIVTPRRTFLRTVEDNVTTTLTPHQLIKHRDSPYHLFIQPDTRCLFGWRFYVLKHTTEDRGGIQSRDHDGTLTATTRKDIAHNNFWTSSVMCESSVTNRWLYCLATIRQEADFVLEGSLSHDEEVDWVIYLFNNPLKGRTS